MFCFQRRFPPAVLGAGTRTTTTTEILVMSHAPIVNPLPKTPKHAKRPARERTLSKHPHQQPEVIEYVSAFTIFYHPFSLRWTQLEMFQLSVLGWVCHTRWLSTLYFAMKICVFFLYQPSYHQCADWMAIKPIAVYRC